MTQKHYNTLVMVIVLLAVWIRFAPLIVWTLQERAWAERTLKEYPECTSYSLDYEWSWWSLRFTDVDTHYECAH